LIVFAGEELTLKCASLPDARVITFPEALVVVQ
jgi:hypothetical protein